MVYRMATNLTTRGEYDEIKYYTQYCTSKVLLPIIRHSNEDYELYNTYLNHITRMNYNSQKTNHTTNKN